MLFYGHIYTVLSGMFLVHFGTCTTSDENQAPQPKDIICGSNEPFEIVGTIMFPDILLVIVSPNQPSSSGHVVYVVDSVSIFNNSKPNSLSQISLFQSKRIYMSELFGFDPALDQQEKNQKKKVPKLVIENAFGLQRYHSSFNDMDRVVFLNYANQEYSDIISLKSKQKEKPIKRIAEYWNKFRNKFYQKNSIVFGPFNNRGLSLFQSKDQKPGDVGVAKRWNIANIHYHRAMDIFKEQQPNQSLSLAISNNETLIHYLDDAKFNSLRKKVKKTNGDSVRYVQWNRVCGFIWRYSNQENRVNRSKVYLFADGNAYVFEPVENGVTQDVTKVQSMKLTKVPYRQLFQCPKIKKNQSDPLVPLRRRRPFLNQIGQLDQLDPQMLNAAQIQMHQQHLQSGRYNLKVIYWLLGLHLLMAIGMMIVMLIYSIPFLWNILRTRIWFCGNRGYKSLNSDTIYAYNSQNEYVVTTNTNSTII